MLAGACAALLRIKGVALGLIVIGGTSLHAASTFTKSLGSPFGEVGGAIVFAGLVALSALAAWVAARCYSRKRGIAWPAHVLAAIPAASLCWSAVPHTPLTLCRTCTLPFAVGLAWSLDLGLASGALALPLALVALILPSLVSNGSG